MVSSPMREDINLRAPFYRLARSNWPCRRCFAAATVFAIALPDAHETLESGLDAATDGDPPADCWQRAGFDAWIFYVGYLPESVRQQLHVIAPGYRYAYSRTTDCRYWINHCEHCGAAQGDYHLHCEIGGAFLPITAETAAEIELLTIPECFAGGAGGYCCDPPLFASLRRV